MTPVTGTTSLQLHYSSSAPEATRRNHIKTIYSGLSTSNFKDHYGDSYLEDNVWVWLPLRVPSTTTLSWYTDSAVSPRFADCNVKCAKFSCTVPRLSPDPDHRTLHPTLKPGSLASGISVLLCEISVETDTTRVSVALAIYWTNLAIDATDYWL